MQRVDRGFAEANVEWFRGFRGGLDGGAGFEIIGWDYNGNIVNGAQRGKVVE